MEHKIFVIANHFRAVSQDINVCWLYLGASEKDVERNDPSEEVKVFNRVKELVSVMQIMRSNPLIYINLKFI